MSGALAVIGLWGAFALSWIAAMVWSRKAQKSLGLGKEALYRLVLIAGGVVFFVPAHGYEGRSGSGTCRGTRCGRQSG